MLGTQVCNNASIVGRMIKAMLFINFISLIYPFFPILLLPVHTYTQSSHPYIFFNQDGMSITFVGFIVTQNGDLIDPTNHGVLEKAIMTKELYTGLKVNKVNFEEDYRTWQKETMIEKIAMVMGVKLSYDPDKSYVLTADNLIKILAIQMRFRFVCLPVLWTVTV